MSSLELNERSKDRLRDVRVLVVDDDVRISRLIQSVLLGLGFEDVTLCHDGKKAVQILQEKRIDFVICDWLMEPMDGMELLQYIRKSPESPNPIIPVIMLSGNSEILQVEAARDAGVTEYVAKPFTARSLCSRIISVIDRPRSFIMAPEFSGPNRRRHKAGEKAGTATQERRHRPDNTDKDSRR